MTVPTGISSVSTPSPISITASRAVLESDSVYSLVASTDRLSLEQGESAALPELTARTRATGCPFTLVNPTWTVEGDSAAIEGGRLVGRVLDEEGAYWIFSDITKDRFRWENVRIREDGTKELACEIFGKRIG